MRAIQRIPTCQCFKNLWIKVVSALKGLNVTPYSDLPGKIKLTCACAGSGEGVGRKLCILRRAYSSDGNHGNFSSAVWDGILVLNRSCSHF